MTTSRLTRRLFVGAALATATTPLLPRLAMAAPLLDPRVETLRAFARDAQREHLVDAAFLTSTGVRGSLPVSSEEAAALRAAFSRTDVEGGLRVAGRRFMVLSVGDDMLHAVRVGGEFLTARRHGELICVATSGPDMAHGRAIEALRQYTQARAVS